MIFARAFVDRTSDENIVDIGLVTLTSDTSRWLESDVMRSELQHLVKNWSVDIPFERSVRSHYSLLQRLEALGLTWATIADALTQAGARHKSGRPISARQMNSVFLRVRKAQHTSSADAVSIGGTPYARTREEEFRQQSFPSQTISDDTRIAVSTKAATAAAPRLLTGLAQRLAEARRLSEANRTEYDD